MDFKHSACGQVVRGERRTVIAKPHEVQWPVDRESSIPFCDHCKRIVDIFELVVENG